MAAVIAKGAFTYERRRPEGTTLYRVVQENVETLYAAVDDGAVSVSLPAFVRKELSAYLECGLLCRGFARLRCGACAESRVVAFSCKGRGFCPSCLGRKMSATAANLVEHVMPRAPLRHYVLTMPFAWRARLGYDGKLLSALLRIFTRTVLAFYKERCGGESGVVAVIQRTQSDLRLNPHVHAVFVDGGFAETGASAARGEVRFTPLGHLRTREVGEVLERASLRMRKYLARRGLLSGGEAEPAEQEPADESESSGEARGHEQLCGSAASGQSPPAGPQWKKKEGSKPLAHVAPTGTVFAGALCAAKDGFTLHAATCAGAEDDGGRERLLRYVLRPAVAQERIQKTEQGLIRIALKKPWSDGTVAVEMDPLSLLCRLAASVPPPKLHTVRYSGVLGSASRLRSRVVPTPPSRVSVTPAACGDDAWKPRSRYRPWAELMMRTLKLDVLECPRCQGRMTLLGLVTDLGEAKRFAKGLGDPPDLPPRTPARGPPYWQSRALRRLAGEAA
jgi:hypothetical protein